MKWETATVETLTKIVTKGTTPTSVGYQFVDEGIPFLRVNNIQDGCLDINDVLFINNETDIVLKRSRILPNDVLISIAGTIGRSTVVPEDAPSMNCNQAIAIIRLQESTNPHYFRYWLNSQEAINQISDLKVTATISNLSLGCINKLRISLPPLEEQKRIAAILDKADRIRRKRQEAIRLTEELGRSIFLDMFGDPVTNPKGWDVNRVIDYCDCIVPARDKPKSFTGKTPWITTADLNFLDETYISNINMGLSTDEIKKAKARMIPKGSVLLTCVGDLGVTSIAGCDMVVNQQLHTFQCQKVNNFFLMYSLPFQKDYMRKRATQTTLPYMNKTSCNSIPIIVPPRELQDKFGDLVSRANKGKELYNNAMQESENLFNSLLQRAFRGEL